MTLEILSLDMMSKVFASFCLQYQVTNISQALDHQRAITTISEQGGRVIHKVHIIPPEAYMADSEGGNIGDLMDDVMSSSKETIFFV